MTPESRVIAQAMHEYNAGALHEGYGLLREHLATKAGELSIKQAALETELQEIEHMEQNVDFIRQSVELLPEANYEHKAKLTHDSTKNAYWKVNKPENYLAIHGLTDRLVWIEKRSSLGSRIVTDWMPAYVVGANKRLGLLASDPSNGDLIVSNTRKARRLADHYSQVMQDPNPDLLKELYDPARNILAVHDGQKHARKLGERDTRLIVTALSDADLHDYNVLSHLMNLAALFDVQREWSRVLLNYTKGASPEDVIHLKAILETRYGKQPELPLVAWESYEAPETEEDIQTEPVDVKRLSRKERQERFRAAFHQRRQEYLQRKQ